eukprot:1693279-Prymnesium_polylepis.1
MRAQPRLSACTLRIDLAGRPDPLVDLPGVTLHLLHLVAEHVGRDETAQDQRRHREAHDAAIRDRDIGNAPDALRDAAKFLLLLVAVVQVHMEDPPGYSLEAQNGTQPS